jgi:glucans biosynthesis protein
MFASGRGRTLRVIAVLASAPILVIPAAMAHAQDAPPAGLVDTTFAAISQRAADLSRTDYVAPASDLPAPFADLDYDGYRKLRPLPEVTVWGETGNPFGVQLLPRGSLYLDPISVHLVGRDGDVETYASDSFVDFVDFPEATAQDRAQLGVSGFRAITQPGVAIEGYEFAVFQGGTYFRVTGEGGLYGVSARALALSTGSTKAEEFPAFTDFWIFEPAPGDETLSLVALSDAPSAAAAYRFALTPGGDASIDVVAEIHPRVDISEAGVAPLSSMFLRGAADAAARTDARPEVHDSDGLAIVTASGEHIWRPLANPASVQTSAFLGAPIRFGLEQRERRTAAYTDPEARYEHRPSVAIEPVGDWGAGDIRLLEIPTATEYADNIAAFWRPADIWRAGEPQHIAYRLHFANAAPLPGPARVISTVAELAPESTSTHRFVITFRDDALVPMGRLTPEVSSAAGEVSNIRVASDGDRLLRISFDLEPGSAPVAELRAALHGDNSQLTETWLFRWTPQS